MKFDKIPIEKLSETPSESGFYYLMKDRYWAVDEDGNALFCRGASPQCNTNKTIVERIVAGEKHPGVKVVFIENAWTPHDC